jgi:hypothetical protein
LSSETGKNFPEFSQKEVHVKNSRRGRGMANNSRQGRIVPFTFGTYWPGAGESNDHTVASSTPVQVKLLQCSPQVPTSVDLQTNPVEQEATIARVEGLVTWYNTSVDCRVDLLSGLYISEWDDSLPGFSTQDPGLIADAMRPNWLRLNADTASLAVYTDVTTVQRVVQRLDFKRPISIRTGKALYLALNQVNGDMASVSASVIIRLWLNRTVA